MGWHLLDSGALYRLVALAGVRSGTRADDAARHAELARHMRVLFGSHADGSEQVRLNGEDVTEAIRTPEVTSGASKIAVIPGVRRAMVAKQREIGERTSVVMEGRDIGTVVFPNAQVKIFLDADPDERVRRRCEEMRAKGEAVQADQLAAQMKERDDRDSTRADAPLSQAPDAVYLDST